MNPVATAERSDYQIVYKHLEEDVRPGKRLGRNVRHDSRSLNYLVEEKPLAAIQSVNWQRVTPVLDQGNLGSCTGNASVGHLGTKPLYDTLGALISGGLKLDEDEAVKVYSLATQLDSYSGTYPPTDTGSDGLSAAKACQKLGLIDGYNHATTLTAVLSALQDGSAIGGFNWYEGFDDPDSNGLVKINGQVRGGHEFELNYVDINNKLVGAINSWSERGGVKGHFYFSWDDLERLLGEDGDVTQFVPKTGDTPTPPPTEDADQTLWDVAGPWASRTRKRADLVALKDALNTWHASK